MGNYLTFAVLLESQVVAEVPLLVPLAATARNLPLWAAVTAIVVLVCLEIALQVFGMVCVTALTCLVHTYHCKVTVGAG